MSTASGLWSRCTTSFVSAANSPLRGHHRPRGLGSLAAYASPLALSVSSFARVPSTVTYPKTSAQDVGLFDYDAASGDTRLPTDLLWGSLHRRRRSATRLDITLMTRE